MKTLIKFHLLFVCIIGFGLTNTNISVENIYKKLTSEKYDNLINANETNPNFGCNRQKAGCFFQQYFHLNFNQYIFILSN